MAAAPGKTPRSFNSNRRYFQGPPSSPEFTGQSDIAVYFRETRPQFLLLTPVCFLVGASMAFWKAGTVNVVYLVISFLGALAAHVAVNVLNDYFDFRSGLDLRTSPTPFSGGSGILPGKQMSPPAALCFGLVSLAIVVAVGVYFFFVRGWGILLAGLPGLLLVGLYTQYITRFPLLCLLAPGLGFGPCMVLGSYYALQGFYDWTAVAASLIPGFLVSNLLNSFAGPKRSCYPGYALFTGHWFSSFLNKGRCSCARNRTHCSAD